MNGTPLKLEIAKGAMEILAGQEFVEVWRTLGITQEQYNVCRGPGVWLREHRQEMRKVLDAFAVGALDLSGFPRFELPAEYLAAVIVVYVHPNNMMAACRTFENARPAQELAGATVDAGLVDPAQLFAICCALYDGDACEAIRQSFEKKARAAISAHPEPLPEKASRK